MCLSAFIVCRVSCMRIECIIDPFLFLHQGTEDKHLLAGYVAMFLEEYSTAQVDGKVEDNNFTWLLRDNVFVFVFVF